MTLATKIGLLNGDTERLVNLIIMMKTGSLTLEQYYAANDIDSAEK